MKHLSIDIETKSAADIRKCGLYRYAQDPDFGILLFAYKLNDDPVQIIDLASGENIPEDVRRMLYDNHVVKHAYNAAFEWYCLNRAGYATPLSQWRCTMAHGLYCGYVAGLEAVGTALGLPQDKKKLKTGRALIRYFCVPCTPSRSNGGRTWNRPQHAPEKWELFKDYCKQDVIAEYEIAQWLSAFPMPEDEQRLWQMDVNMNAFGVRVDRQLMKGALSIDADARCDLTEESVAVTGVSNPNSPAQLIGWMAEKGVETDDLRKETVSALLDGDIPDDVREALQLRQQLGKTSVKKYAAMDAAVCDDDRIRGLTQYYGANRTGRWAGRMVQMQNLPRNYLRTLDTARALVKVGNYEGVRLLYGDVQDTLSQLIRTAFIPSQENKFVVADFSAIEARVIAWLAGETWVNDVFATHGKIYEATASQMFGVPIENIVKGKPEYALRQKGKVATLALGYQGGVNALIAMGALKMGLAEEELPEIVGRWRKANPRIRDLWYSIEEAAVATIATGVDQGVRGLIFRYEGELTHGQTFLTVQLPSGRKLFYPRPSLRDGKFGRPELLYYSAGQSKKWEVTSTYGGKLTENIVQAIARDCLAETLRRIEAKGLQVVFHVHDEVIIDAPQSVSVDEICDLMAEPIKWAPGLILKGAGFESRYYMKD